MPCVCNKPDCTECQGPPVKPCAKRKGCTAKPSAKPAPLSALTIKRARWFRDLCRECPFSYNLDATISDTDCVYLAEALDFAIRMSARQWKPVKPTK